ncbi:carbohydrate ABC transporter permease [Lacrimispora sp.]|uniref:carbohydrate ABC transporter permease n=1 Tax=Lacrimispora sp. TaxID=2719234 RepID=UPI002896B420|nr:carbohydrate ABC transporter permease [Lacrimispora sp.]
MNGKAKWGIWSVLAFLVIAFFALLCIFPFIYMILMSFTQSSTLTIRLSDMSFSNISNYYYVLISSNFTRALVNSIIIAGFSCFFNCLISAMAAYGFGKKDFPGKRFIFSLYMLTLMVPGQVTLIPVFVIMRKLNLLNTYFSLIVLIINAFGVFLIKQFMDGVPDELLEAAQIDGCPDYRIFLNIVIPLLKPVLVSLTIFTFVNTWNNFLWPLVAVTKSEMYTLTVALSLLKTQYSVNYGFIMAGSAITFIFPFVLYVVLQKQFVEGIALSGVKG